MSGKLASGRIVILFSSLLATLLSGCSTVEMAPPTKTAAATAPQIREPAAQPFRADASSGTLTSFPKLQFEPRSGGPANFQIPTNLTNAEVDTHGVQFLDPKFPEPDSTAYWRNNAGRLVAPVELEIDGHAYRVSPSADSSYGTIVAIVYDEASNQKVIRALYIWTTDSSSPIVTRLH